MTQRHLPWCNRIAFFWGLIFLLVNPIACSQKTQTNQPKQKTVTVVAAGDIACDPESSNFNEGLGSEKKCRQKYVADLIGQVSPDAVLTLGDHQYEDSTFNKFMASYDLSWGKYKSLTYPVVGNHEYLTANASGYYAYFGSRAGQPDKGYYSFDLGAWHVVALNSNCDQVGGCEIDSPQAQWLESDLGAHMSQCTLAYWHHPRFSSGKHGSDTRYTDFWKLLYEAGADLILVGHDHNYERFALQDPRGHADATRGIRQFVVGTGGKSLRLVDTLEPNSEVRDSGTYGVLKLTLRPSSYDWEFIPEEGQTFTDKGTGNCH